MKEFPGGIQQGQSNMGDSNRGQARSQASSNLSAPRQNNEAVNEGDQSVIPSTSDASSRSQPRVRDCSPITVPSRGNDMPQTEQPPDISPMETYAAIPTTRTFFDLNAGLDVELSELGLVNDMCDLSLKLTGHATSQTDYATSTDHTQDHQGAKVVLGGEEQANGEETISIIGQSHSSCPAALMSINLEMDQRQGKEVTGKLKAPQSSSVKLPKRRSDMEEDAGKKRGER